MAGFYVVVLSKSNSTDARILSWTRWHGQNPQDDDAIVAVDFQVGGHVRFSNSLFSGQVATTEVDFVSLRYDPPGDLGLKRGPSQHTYFDDAPLSSRSAAYQTVAVEFFADFVLSGLLATRYYVVEPSADVLSVTGGQLPQTLEDIAALVRADPQLMRRVQCHEEPFRPEQLSPGARTVIRSLLQDRHRLEQFLENPEAYIREAPEIRAVEAEALRRAARDQADLVRRAYDSVELGRARGDENTYILLGVDRARKRLNPAALDWLVGQLDAFAEENGFVPAFGGFVTEARQRYRVVLGPGVSDRERDYLALFGHELIDRRDGAPIGRLDGGLEAVAAE